MAATAAAIAIATAATAAAIAMAMETESNTAVPAAASAPAPLSVPQDSGAPRTGRLALVAGLVLLIAFAAAFAGYYFYFKANLASPFEAAKREADSNLENGRALLVEGSGSAAIPWLEQARAAAPDAATKAQAEVNLGSAYAQAGNNEKGIMLWKEVSLNENYPLAYRTTAAGNVIQSYVSDLDPALATTTVFTGPVWGSFLASSDPTRRELNDAVRRALEWTVSLDPAHPPLSSSYRLAGWYAADITATTTAGRKDDIDLAKRYLAMGDTAYRAAVAENEAARAKNPDALPAFVNAVLGGALTLKARAEAALYLAKVPDETIDAVAKDFSDGIALIEKDGISSASLFARYHLAAFLVTADPAGRKAALLETLAPLYDAGGLKVTSSFFKGFLTTYGERPDVYRDSATWEKLTALAKADPRFKQLLSELGWNAKDLP